MSYSCLRVCLCRTSVFHRKESTSYQDGNFHSRSQQINGLKAMRSISTWITYTCHQLGITKSFSWSLFYNQLNSFARIPTISSKKGVLLSRSTFYIIGNNYTPISFARKHLHFHYKPWNIFSIPSSAEVSVSSLHRISMYFFPCLRIIISCQANAWVRPLKVLNTFSRCSLEQVEASFLRDLFSFLSQWMYCKYNQDFLWVK